MPFGFSLEKGESNFQVPAFRRRRMDGVGRDNGSVGLGHAITSPQIDHFT
jgi:hypothetical protein